MATMNCSIFNQFSTEQIWELLENTFGKDWLKELIDNSDDIEYTVSELLACIYETNKCLHILDRETGEILEEVALAGRLHSVYTWA